MTVRAAERLFTEFRLRRNIHGWTVIPVDREVDL